MMVYYNHDPFIICVSFIQDLTQPYQKIIINSNRQCSFSVQITYTEIYSIFQ